MPVLLPGSEAHRCGHGDKSSFTWLLCESLMMLGTASTTEDLMLANSYDLPSTPNMAPQLKWTSLFLVEGKGQCKTMHNVCFSEESEASVEKTLALFYHNQVYAIDPGPLPMA